MGNSTQNPERFKEAWYDHINELSKLGMSVEPDKISELRELQQELRDLVDEATENFED